MVISEPLPVGCQFIAVILGEQVGAITSVYVAKLSARRECELPGERLIGFVTLKRNKRPRSGRDRRYAETSSGNHRRSAHAFLILPPAPVLVFIFDLTWTQGFELSELGPAARAITNELKTA